MIDKAPASEFSEKMVLQWKADHEARIRAPAAKTVFNNRQELWNSVGVLLKENHFLWRHLGPESEAAESNPASNLYVIWNLRKIDTIVPKNNRIIEYIDSNAHHLTVAELEAFLKFKMHAQAFETHQYKRTKGYPLFPEEFSGMFKNE